MSKPISKLEEILALSGDEESVIAFQGRNFKFKLKNLKSIIPVPTKGDIGLGSVDNTSDSDKPISNATQEALDTKAPLEHTHDISEITGLDAIGINVFFKAAEW